MPAEKTTGIRTFYCTQSISGVLDVPMSEWPPSIMDKIDEAVEKLSRKHELLLKIVHGEYKTDPDIPEHLPGHHYLHVELSEIVAADERNLDPDRVIRELPDDIKRMLN